MSRVSKRPSARGSTIARSMRPRRAYSRRMTSSESNSPRVATTRGVASSAFSTARRPCPALVLGTIAVGARHAQQRRETRTMRRDLRAPRVPCAAQFGVPVREALANVVLGGVERTAERVVGEVDALAVRELVRARTAARRGARTALAVSSPGPSARGGGVDALGGRRSVHRRASGCAPIAVRTSISSGKNVWSSARLRNATPDEPPVPVLWPMIRSTVFMWRKRQSWKPSSMSTSFSHMSYAPHQRFGSLVDRAKHRHEVRMRDVRLRDSRVRGSPAAPAGPRARDGAGTRRRATARAAARSSSAKRRRRRGGTRRASPAACCRAGTRCARYCADWKPDDVPSAGRNASYSDGVSVSSTAHCSNSCFWISLTRARILKLARAGRRARARPPPRARGS